MNQYGNPGENGPQEETGRAMRLMEALSEVDEGLLERCAGRQATALRRPLWRSARAIAAVLCLAVVGAASWGGYQLSQRKMGSPRSSDGNTESYLEGAEEGEMLSDAAAGEAAPEEAEGAIRAGQGSEEIPWAEDAPEDGRETLPGQEAVTEEKTEQDSGGTQEAAEEGEESSAVYETCLPLESRKLTLAQAKEDALLGAYLPGAFPAGYAFEEAYCVTEGEGANLTVCWSRGMDYITLHLERPGNAPATVDVGKPETYDQRLYEVPYGETVPREYWHLFDNPVFAREDLSLEIVKSRMKSYEDRGDTDTPRGNFGVLYPEGVLIRFSGRGTAEEIWEMFCSIGGEE